MWSIVPCPWKDQILCHSSLLQIKPLKILDTPNLKWWGPHGQVIPYVFSKLVVCQKVGKWNWLSMSQPYFEKSVRMRLTLPKWGLESPLGLGSPPGLPKVQSSIARVKTPCIGAFFISLKSYWSVDIKNGLSWTIWTSKALVMAKRKARNQIDNLTFDH
jgi:hypothetical protein